VLGSLTHDEAPEVSNNGQSLFDGAVGARTGARAPGPFAGANEVIGEVGHGRSKRIRDGVDAPLATAPREVRVVAESESEVFGDEEFFEGARQRTNGAAGTLSSFQHCLGL
jgi:hypothetical protein